MANLKFWGKIFFTSDWVIYFFEKVSTKDTAHTRAERKGEN